jgi:RNA polymerase sigma-70 factor, ECF subfamily
MEAYGRGEDLAFDRVYTELASALLRYLHRLTGQQATAEDLLHQTFLQMHLARGSFHPGADVEPWAFAIARRLYLNLARRLRRETVGTSDREGGAGVDRADAQQLWEAQAMSARLHRELLALPEALRETFVLVFEQELSFEQAAQVLGASPATLRVRYHRARERLREALDSVELSAPTRRPR